MDDADIKLLSEQEQTYWWHISRRMILESILQRFFSRHPGESLERLQNRMNKSIRSWTSQDDACCHPEQNESGVEGSPPLDSLTTPALGEASLGMRIGRLGMTRRKKLKILDVGCGTGENFYWLSKFGQVVGTDTNELAIQLANQKGRAVLGRAEDLPFENGEFNLVTAFDVLEHLSDERRALGEWGRVLCPGGQIFISVPAHQWLFGPHDRALGHCRRYELKQLLQLLRDNNFYPIFSTYVFGFAFPVFVLQRWLARYSSEQQTQYVNIPNWLNSLLIGLGRLEAHWLHFAKVPWGSSIVVLVRKQ